MLFRFDNKSTFLRRVKYNKQLDMLILNFKRTRSTDDFKFESAANEELYEE